MDLARAVLARLEASSAVTDEVAERIWWLRRDQGAPLPAIVLSQISRTPEGDTLEEEGPVWSSQVQIDCWARGHDGFSTARRIAAAARAALIEPGEHEGFEFLGTDTAGPIDFTEDGAVGPLFRATLNLTIRHGEES